MAEETVTTTDTNDTETEQVDVEKQAFLDRLNQEGGKRKEAEKKAATLQKQLEDLASRLEERETAGLPELEREKKAREALEKRLAEAEDRAQASERAVERTRREQWVAQAAQKLGFANPARAAKLVDDLDSLDDSDAAERAVKALAKSDPYLVKNDDAQPKIGRVLEGGKAASGDSNPLSSNIDLDEEAASLAAGLQKYLR